MSKRPNCSNWDTWKPKWLNWKLRAKAHNPDTWRPKVQLNIVFKDKRAIKPIKLINLYLKSLNLQSKLKILYWNTGHLSERGKCYLHVSFYFYSKLFYLLNCFTVFNVHFILRGFWSSSNLLCVVYRKIQEIDHLLGTLWYT